MANYRECIAVRHLILEQTFPRLGPSPTIATYHGGYPPTHRASEGEIWFDTAELLFKIFIQGKWRVIGLED